MNIHHFTYFNTASKIKDSGNINMKNEIAHYLQRDINYIKKKIELNFLKNKHNPLFSLIPIGRYNIPNKSAYQMHNNLILEWGITGIFEELISFFTSPNIKKAVYDLKQYEQNTALKIQELIKKFFELLSDLVGEYKVYQYLWKELEKKESLYSILEEDDLNDLFTLRHNILTVMEKLYKLDNEMQLFIMENKEYFTTTKIEELKNLFHSDPLNLSYIQYTAKYNPLPQPKNLGLLLNKLPVQLSLTYPIDMSSTGLNSAHSWNLFINPPQYLKYLIQIYYEKKKNRGEKHHLQNQWNKQWGIQENKKKFYQNKLLSTMEMLDFMEKTLVNEEALHSIKSKHIWDHQCNLIRKREEKKLIQFIILIYDLIIFNNI